MAEQKVKRYRICTHCGSRCSTSQLVFVDAEDYDAMKSRAERAEAALEALRKPAEQLCEKFRTYEDMRPSVVELQAQLIAARGREDGKHDV